MLSLLGSIYGKVIDLRNRLYDRGVFETFDLGARTIGIGNITTGGTGKTPLVAHIAQILADRGETVCILTRGYGRANPKRRVLVSDKTKLLASVEDAGDEPFELAQKLIGKTIVIADADRVAAADWAKRKFAVTAFVLDDGFQHRKARRDVNIVCIDATNPFDGGKMLPAGRLREPLHNLKRADVVVITRADLAIDLADLKFQISNLIANKPIFEAENRITRIIPIAEFFAKDPPQQNPDALKGRAYAFCGLGNPDNFFALLSSNDIDLVDKNAFQDHHVYDQKDIMEIERLANSSHAEVLLTTAKDAVKLLNFKFEVPVYVVEIEMVLDDEGGFAAML